MELGFISGVFGVQGEVRLFLHNEESDTLDDERRVVLVRGDGTRVEARMRARSGAGKRIIGRIGGLTDREIAASMKGWRVAIAIADLPEPEAGEFYVHDLEGLSVRIGEREVGRVATVHATPGGDVLEIETADGRQFVPAIERFVLDVDLDAGAISLADDALDEP